MAVRPDYTTGTITLTEGETGFSCTGSALQSASIHEGDLILLPAKGLSLVIASVTSETTGTLTDPCPADAAGADQALRIRYQPDGSRYSAKVQALVELLGSGNAAELAELNFEDNPESLLFVGVAGALGLLDISKGAQSLLGLTAAADQLPYFTGTDTAALADFPASARSLLALTAAADQLPYYADDGGGGVTAALTSLTAFARTLLAGEDAGAVRTAIGANDASNLSTGTVPAARIPSDLTPDKAFRRGNILGTVSQSSGVPTGAIIERGSNANGEYVRFADGTQICWSPVLQGTIENATGNIFVSDLILWNFPILFTSAPHCFADFYSAVETWGTTTNPTDSLAGIRILSATSSATVRNGRAIAFGRWF